MVQYNPLQYLPSAEELPDSDDTPVDNELQIPVAALLRAILSWLWVERQDWFFGVNMGVYYQPPNSCIVPDGFLSLGVVRRKSERGRPSYVLWEENNVQPLLVIEIVSQTPGQEYGDKQIKYAQIGVLYQRTEQAQQQLEQERQRASQERREREELVARLRSRGIDPDAL
ncbi:MAG: Uma2 family endonuclease [Chroococcidiopsidaceae cyanobacterium CP_BM_ER_R8_30]|nr:Uma2 family endonuclease [Chroococcidiopsidaceae cyanobacterium CP_BM_ER_R8_30]